MPKSTLRDLDYLFDPKSIGLVGITVDNPDHWTRTFFDALLEFKFDRPIYLVNPKGGEIEGRKVYRSLDEIPETLDYVISTVPASVAPDLVRECAARGIKAVHFCTSGFNETGEEDRVNLENQLADIAHSTGVRILGPNCMGIYCPKTHISFNETFPKDGGSVGFISQSGGNAAGLVWKAMLQGIRFSKVISYGNACDLNESDFLDYLADDPDTNIIAIYVEGVKDGPRFRQALSEAREKKPVVLLKGGTTEGGARAAAGHTGSLAGSEATWDALCRQLKVFKVHTLEQLSDTLVALQLMTRPKGRSAALIGAGGGNSVLIADAFERVKLAVPPLPEDLRGQIRSFTPVAGNILRNPIDYSQTLIETDKFFKMVKIVTDWEGIDFVVGFFNLSQAPPRAKARVPHIAYGLKNALKVSSKPVAIVIEPSIVPEDVMTSYPLIQLFVSAGFPVFFSFIAAARAISLVLEQNP